MKKQIFLTTYRKAWIEYKKTPDYKRISDLLESKGVQQPYRDNWIMSVFAAGWNATGVKIEPIIVDLPLKP